MRVERLGGDKVRFFLTLDDLIDRGIEKEDMWRDIPKVHELFNDMMDHAYQELGFEVVGPVAVEVFAPPAQGMIVVVSCERTSKLHHYDESDDEDVYELEVTMEETDEVVFRFSDFEYLVQAAIQLQSFVKQGQVYVYQGAYYIVLDSQSLSKKLNAAVAVLSEFGEVSTVTKSVLHEYGKAIWPKSAIRQIVKYFG